MADTAPADAAPAEWLSEHHSPAPQAATGVTTLSEPAKWFQDFLTGNSGGQAGPVVNEHTAIGYAALYACVSLIAGTIASLPLKVYRRRRDGGQDEVPERPEWGLFQNEFNPNTSAMSGREAGIGHLLTWGNSYAQIVRNKRPTREVFRLQPLGPDIVCPETNDRGELEYTVTSRETGKVLQTLARDEVLHVPGLSFDAMVGYSVVKVAKTVIRTGMAQDREAERFVTRGTRPPGAIKFPQGKKFADAQQAIKFRNTFKALHNTEDGSINVIILEDGAEWQTLSVDPKSSQLLESRQFSPQEICSIYHVPPHMIGLVDKVSSWGTGIEEMTIGFVVYCLLPTLRRIEQEYNRKLFAGTDLYCEHVLAGLLRGDTLKQAQAIQIYMNLGLITTNEARKLLGMNPVKGGDVRYFQLNMGRIDEDGNDIPAVAAVRPEAQAAPAPAALPANERTGARSRGPEKVAAPLRRAIAAAAARCLRKEGAEAVQAAKKPGAFVEWIDRFYAKHADMLAESVGPLVETWEAALGACPYSAAEHVNRSRGELLAAAECRAEELPNAVARVTDRWTSARITELMVQLTTLELEAAA